MVDCIAADWLLVNAEFDDGALTEDRLTNKLVKLVGYMIDVSFIDGCLVVAW